jgi:hypothetical protein
MRTLKFEITVEREPGEKESWKATIKGPGFRPPCFAVFDNRAEACFWAGTQHGYLMKKYGVERVEAVAILDGEQRIYRWNQ